MLSFIVMGERTSHGGAVISASPFSTTNDKAIARVTDAEGCTQWIERDAPEALAFDLIENGEG